MNHCAACKKDLSESIEKHVLKGNTLCNGCYTDFLQEKQGTPQRGNRIFKAIGISVLGIFLFMMGIAFLYSPSDFSETTPTGSAINERITTSNTKAMQEPAKVDYLTYKITKAETFTDMGSSVFNKQTNGKFVKVYMDILNDAKETKDIFTPRFRLEDNRGRTYDRLSEDMLYIVDSLSFGQQLQPGLKISGAIVFEVPKDATDFTMLITGDWLSDTEVKVKLNSIKNIGEDTTQKAEEERMLKEVTDEAEKEVEKMMNQCSPFKCSSSCSEYLSLGKKDCPNGQVCCME